jgi:anti-anti-sigma regulatory factor
MRGETPPDPDGGWGALHQMSQDEADVSAVSLAAVQEPIARVLERTGMLRLFQTHATRDDAVAALRGA